MGHGFFAKHLITRGHPSVIWPILESPSLWHPFLHICLSIYVCIIYKYIIQYVYIYMYIYICMYACIYIYICVQYIYVYIHIMSENGIYPPQMVIFHRDTDRQPVEMSFSRHFQTFFCRPILSLLHDRKELFIQLLWMNLGSWFGMDLV